MDVAHRQQKRFTQGVKDMFPGHFANVSVLDAGSLNVNGDNRFLFKDYTYTGIDIVFGRNVDVVTLIHQHDAPNENFDIIVSTEAFEHDKFWVLSLQNLVRMLKPGGMLLFTCATQGRKRHHYGPKSWDYYGPLTEFDVRQAIPVEEVFSEFEFRIGREMHDLYFWGVKRA